MGLGCSLRLFQKGGASMAGWEQELAELLRGLGGTQEEPKTHLPSTSKLMHSDVKRRQPATESIILGNIGGGRADDEDSWLFDVGWLRREIDSYVRQMCN